MKINLYIDNDSRPRGSYENVRHAEHQPGLLCFTTITGKKFHTNLNYLLEVEEGDKVSFANGVCEIVGRPKPKATPATGQKAMPFTPEKDDDF